MTELTREEEYGIIIKHLTSITSFRKFASQQDFDSLVDIHEKLKSLIDDRRDEAELRKMELQELEEKRLKTLKYLEEIGLSPEDLSVSVFDKEPKKKGKGKSQSKRADKYAYTDENGKTVKWSGVGRMNNVFKKLQDEGKNLDDYLINKDNTAE